MPENLSEKIRIVMGNVLQVPLERITEDLEQKNLAEWDSFHHMDLIMAFEENFGIALSDDEVVKMTDFKTILNILEKRVRG